MNKSLLPNMLVLSIALLFSPQTSYTQAPTSITISPANPTTNGQDVQFSALNGALIPLQSVVQTQYGLSVGYADACAVLVDGTVRCWGDNTYGQLGNGTTTQSTTPVQVSGLGNATAIATGKQHACALLSDGNIACWGDNTYGQLGNGTNTAALAPVLVANSDGTTFGAAIALSAGDLHTCAITKAGSAYCWGDNSHGQLGNGSTTGSNTPVVVSGLTGIVSIASGKLHNCAVVFSNNSNVYCWGDNSWYQLDNLNYLTPSSTPEEATQLENWGQQISASGYSTCLTGSSSGPYCWGAIGGAGAPYSPFNGAVSGWPVGVDDQSSGSVAPGPGRGTVCFIDPSYHLWCAIYTGTWSSPQLQSQWNATGVLSVSGDGDNSQNNMCANLGDGTVSCWSTNVTYQGSPSQITNYLLPSGGTSQTEVAWSSSNPSVATITASGYAVPVSPGTTTITATYGSLTAANTTLIVQALAVAPTFSSLPLQNITAAASSSVGAVVTYPLPTATAGSNPVTVTCTPASGSTFAIGTTPVTCTAVNTVAPSLTATAQFTVTVTTIEDVTAAGLSCIGCVGNSQLGINYAMGDSQGGNALNALMLGGLLPTAYQLAGPYATTGANTFSGNQNITGNLIATGNLSGASGNFTGSLSATGVVLPFTNAATASQGYTSNPLDVIASIFNSASQTSQSELFRWQAEPVAASNNTAAPSATLNLLFGSNGTPNETGLSVNANGTINFASGQVFPGSGTGTISGITAGAGLSGGGTSGNVTLANTGVLSLSAGPGLTTTAGQTPTLSLNTAFTDARYLLLSGGMLTGSLAAQSFVGNGSALTNLNPASLSSGTAGINISGNAATATTALTATSATTATLAGNVTGVVAVANGGTGVSTAGANTVFAGPVSGAAAPPVFRALALGDTHTVLNMDVSAVTVRNTTAETAVYSFSVPGGTLSANGSAVRVTLVGSYQNGVAIGDGFKVRVYYGGTVLWGDFAPTLKALTAGSLGGVRLELLLLNNGSTSAQKVGGVAAFSGIPQSAAVAGSGAFMVPLEAEVVGSSSVDSTVPQTFKITIQPNVANSNLAFTMNAAAMELLQ